MIAGFFVAMFSGHIYVIAIVTAIQIMSFKEVIAIANVPSKEKNLRFTKSLNWYFLATTMYFLYGESVIYYFKHVLLVDRVLLPFATHHRFISFVLYVMGESMCLPSTPSMCSRSLIAGGCPKRVCLLCGHAAKRPLPVSVYAIRLDPYGSLPDCRPSPFHHEQHF